MLNTLSTLIWDVEGYVELNVKDNQTVGEYRRRANRVSTLDGYAVVNDAGFSDADRTIELKWTPVSEAAEAAIARMIRFYSQVKVSTRAGVFTALLETYTPGADEATLRLLALSKSSI